MRPRCLRRLAASGVAPHPQTLAPIRYQTEERLRRERPEAKSSAATSRFAVKNLESREPRAGTLSRGSRDVRAGSESPMGASQVPRDVSHAGARSIAGPGQRQVDDGFAAAVEAEQTVEVVIDERSEVAGRQSHGLGGEI